MDARESLAAIVQRLEAIEKVLAQYSAAIRTRQESDKTNPQSVRAEITFDDASKREGQAEADRQNTTQEKIGRYAFYAFLAAIIYAGISALQLYEMRIQTAQVFHQSEIENANASGQNAQLSRQLNIADRQAKAAQNSVAAVQKQMREDQRAWLTISMGNVSWSEGNPISIPITVRNIGKTAARKFAVNVVVRQVENTSSGGKSITFKYNGVPHSLDFAGYVLPNDPGFNFVAQSEEFAPDKKTIQASNVSHESAIKLNAGQEFIISYAEATYVDIFGVSHWTKLCKFNSPSGKNAHAAKCTTYDDVDSN